MNFQWRRDEGYDPDPGGHAQTASEFATIGIYTLDNEGRPQPLAECDDDSLAFCLRTLTDEGQIACNSEVGIFDLKTRTWICNPWPASPFGNRRTR